MGSLPQWRRDLIDEAQEKEVPTDTRAAIDPRADAGPRAAIDPRAVPRATVDPRADIDTIVAMNRNHRSHRTNRNSTILLIGCRFVPLWRVESHPWGELQAEVPVSEKVPIIIPLAITVRPQVNAVIEWKGNRDRLFQIWQTKNIKN